MQFQSMQQCSKLITFVYKLQSIWTIRANSESDVTMKPA
uniref:Uncharacterized protein n=1 Tax=Arundo donax TaxID=35708 RepID=A0A0A9CWP2_ARUDO